MGDDPNDLAALAEFERDFDATYGAPPAPPWHTPLYFDGQAALAPRRPDLLGDQTAALWTDLTAWVVWATLTFRLTRWFPPCWPQHPALVEELLALWGTWQAAWIPAIDPTAPTGFLRELDAALGRVERLWKPPCTGDSHKDQPEPLLGADGTPTLHHWWSNPNYLQGEAP